MTQADWHVGNMASLDGNEAKAAYLHLIVTAATSNMKISFKSNAIDYVKLEGEAGYQYSFIVNAADLLFYVRKPALKFYRLEMSRFGVFKDVTESPSGELKIRVQTYEDARKLTQTLPGFRH